MAEIDGDATDRSPEPEAVVSSEVVTLDLQLELQTLSVSERVMGIRLLPYNTVAVHPRYGPLMFRPGAFGQVDPASVRLRMDHTDPPTGKGRTFTDKPDAPYMDFQLSKTQRADEQLTLAKDGVSRGASVGFADIVGRPQVQRIDGQNVTVYGPDSARLAEVSTTWQPTFESAGVTYMLHRQQEGVAPVAEQETPAAGAQIDTTAIAEAITRGFADGKSFDRMEAAVDKMLGVVDQWSDLQRAQFNVPQGEARKPKLHAWVEVALRRLAGQAISPTELKALALDDVVTTEQPGLVPTQFTPDYDDLINNDRPFLRSTRQIVPPATGNSMVLPLITTRAVAGTQAESAEKGELTTTATKVGTGTFAYVSVFGGADISIQMINRAEASFFDLLTGDMAMAYALDCDKKAISALLTGFTAAPSGGHVPVSGGILDPENLSIGAAWQTSITVYRRAPDTIWLSAAAVAAFIDAKAPLTNAPLYSNLAAAFTTAGGPGGTLSGLRPVYVPALDADPSGVDVIIGPSRGFVWAEDPARTLQSDVPSKAGRDIALVGGIFPAPRYADAFTIYTIGS
jgi:phage head maturation protease